MPKPKVALCVTCTVDQIMPDIGVATVKLLRRAGFDVEFPQAQTCCGQPFFNSGFREEASHLAKRLITIFAPYEAVVLPGGSCTSMIRVEYAHLFADDPIWHQQAQQLAAKTYELSEFLTKHTDWQISANRSVAQTITYHDSCHMCRTLKLKDEPRQALTEAGYTITEMSNSERCCGFGGLFSIRMPEVSNAMSAEKLRQADETQTGTLVTSDPGCLMQLRGLAHETPNLRVEHIATVLEEATR